MAEIPIINLSGFTSLTDVLSDLPLPAPLPKHSANLLDKPELVARARQLLHCQDEALVSKLVNALGSVSTDYLDFKNPNINSDVINHNELPPLLQAVLQKDPHVFKKQRLHRNSPITTKLPETTLVATEVDEAGIESCDTAEMESKQQPSDIPLSNIDAPFSPEQSPGSHALPQFMSSSSPIRPARPWPQVTKYNLLNSCGVVSQESNALTGNPVKDEPPGCGSSLNIINQSATFQMPQKKQILKKQHEMMGNHYPAVHLTDVMDPSRAGSKPISSNGTSGSECRMLHPVVVLERTVSEHLFQQASETPDVREPGKKSRELDKLKDYWQPDPGEADFSTRKRKAASVAQYKFKHEFNQGADVPSPDSGEDYQRVTKRRRLDSSGESEPDDDGVAPHKRLVSRKDFAKVKAGRFLTREEMLESRVYSRFISAIDNVLEAVEELDIVADVTSVDDEWECPPEFVIPLPAVKELSTLTAEFKSIGGMKQVSHKKLVKLLQLLDKNIRDACRSRLDQEPSSTAGEDRIWRQLMLDKINRSLESTLITLNILTSNEMPKKVYLEDAIEDSIAFTKFHLTNTIYPRFDPAYKTGDSKNKPSAKVLRAKGPKTDTRFLIMYNKLCEIVNCFSVLVQCQELTDTLILPLSSLAISTFFVENVSELQLNALKLTTVIFSIYPAHRQLILDDILASLSRLPTTKKNLRVFAVSDTESVQMVTALVLQLVQGCVVLPRDEGREEESMSLAALLNKSSKKQAGINAENKKKDQMQDCDVILQQAYDNSSRVAQSFLSVFLSKCSSKCGEEDFRPIFENFVHDLLVVVNQPEWPAAELILSLLGFLLMKHFSNRSTDMSLRTASLDYLGIVAAKLRKDGVSGEHSIDEIKSILEEIDEAKVDDDVDITQRSQHELCRYLTANKSVDCSFEFARNFYFAQWFKDCSLEVEKAQGSPNKKQEVDPVVDMDDVNAKVQVVEKCREFLRSLVSDCESETKKNTVFLTDKQSHVFSIYLASKRSFNRSFNVYLTQILRTLTENAVAVRTKAMKCLALVVESDPGILARKDMQLGVHGRLQDSSTNVREAAMELLGKFILLKPQLVDQYYDMIVTRILDTGVTVRKRVIRILRDICVSHPGYPKTTEICIKIIRRVNDEESIKKLVNEVFTSMWFTPIKARDEDLLIKRVQCINDVVGACIDSRGGGLEWFEALLANLFTAEDGNKASAETSANLKQIRRACQQIVDCLVEHVLNIEEREADKEADDEAAGNKRVVACMATLYLFCKVRPELVVIHAETLHPYLSTKCSNKHDLLIIDYVCNILEILMPLLSNPSPTFLATIEEAMLKIMMNQNPRQVQSSISCLAAVINGVSHNVKFAYDCFKRFFDCLEQIRGVMDRNSLTSMDPQRYSFMLRSLFVTGLFAKHFELDKDLTDSDDNHDNKTPLSEKTYDLLFSFSEHKFVEARLKAINGLGFLCLSNPHLLLGHRMRELYTDIMENGSPRMKAAVLGNIQGYLQYEEIRSNKIDLMWSKRAKDEDLKEMQDVQSGMASSVIQIYLKLIFDTCFSLVTDLRALALNVISLTLQQGLIHPVRCVPYLVAMESDVDATIRDVASAELLTIERKYPGVIQMKATQGVRDSYRLQCALNPPSKNRLIVRGFRDEACRRAHCHHLYTVIRSSRQHRRALVVQLLTLLDCNDLPLVLYLCDNLAYFPYQTQDEILFLVHHCDVCLSVTGTDILSNFQRAIVPKPSGLEEGKSYSVLIEDLPRKSVAQEETLDEVLERIPDNPTPALWDWYESMLCSSLQVYLKTFLKEAYALSEQRCQQYSPTDASKSNDKPASCRASSMEFRPAPVLAYLERLNGSPLTPDVKREIADQYLWYKDTMLCLDPVEEEVSDFPPPGADGTDRPPPRLPKMRIHLAATALTGLRSDTTSPSLSTMSGVTDASSGATDQVSIGDDIIDDVVPAPEPEPDEATAKKKKSKRGKDKKPKKKQRKKKRKRYSFLSSEGTSGDGGESDPDFRC